MATLNNVIANANGCVGIGTTTLLSKFVVSNGSSENFEFTPASVSFNGGIFEYINRATGATRPDFNFYLGGGGGAYKFYTQGNNERMRIAGDGNIGIGTTSPAQKLSVVGNIYLPQGNYITWNNGDCDIGGVSGYHLVFRTYTGVSMTEKLRIQSDGNVGIGTTTPSSKLHISNTTAATRITITDDVANGRSGYIESNYSDALVIGTTSGVRSIKFAPDNSTAMTIAVGTNNVGIGTTNPVSKVHISGSGQTIMRLDGSTTTSVSQFQIKAASDAVLIMGMQGGSAASTNFGVTAAGQAYFGTTTLGSLHPTSLVIGTASPIPTIFSTNNSEKMRITSDGNVGIGTTSPSNTKLHIVADWVSGHSTIKVQGITDNTTGYGFYNTSGTRTGYIAYVGSAFEWYNNEAIPIIFYASGLEKMRIASDGNVGISTTSPGRPLEVKSTNIAIRMNNTSNTNAGLEYYVSTGTYFNWVLGAQYNVSDGFEITPSTAAGGTTYSSPKFVVKANGNVGIGTTSPASRLDVSGSINTNNGLNISRGNIGFTTDTTEFFIKTTMNGGAIRFRGNSGAASDRNVQLGNVDNNGNWTSYLIAEGGGNVGIGTTSPADKLTIPADNYLSFQTSNVTFNSGRGARIGATSTGSGIGELIFETYKGGSGGGERMRITSDGCVGIGTATPVSNCRLTLQSSNTARFAITDGTTTANIWPTGGNLYISTETASDLILITNANERMRILSGGNVGIGTSSPTNKLHIYTSDNEPVLIQGTTAGTWLNFQSSTSNLLSIGADGTRGIGFYNRTTSVDLMTINNVGNLGIGTTSPLTKLDIANTQASGITMRFDTSTSYQAWIRPYWNSTTDTRIDFAINRAGGSTPDVIMSVGYGGNVGIGTTSPAYKLDVSGTARVGDVFLVTTATTSDARIEVGSGRSGNGNSYLDLIGDATYTDYGLRLIRYDSGANSNSRLEHRGTGQLQLFTTEAAALVISTNSSERVRVDSSGNVGIGTTSPTKLLHLYAGNDYASVRLQNTAASKVWDLTPSIPGVANSGFSIYNLTDDSVPFHITNAGNVGIGTTAPVALLDVRGSTKFGSSLSNTHQFTGSVNFGGSTYNDSIAIDKFEYFSLQPYIEGGSFPSNVLSLAGTFPTFVTITGSACPFGKVAYNVSYYEAIGDYIPVNPGETLYGEIWAYRSAGATGTAGQFYCGIARYDKDKKPIATNLALTYFLASAVNVPVTSTWTKYSGTTTLPTTHTPFNGSDGGPVRYVRPYIIVNNPSGTIPTYWAAWKIRKQQLTRDSGAITISGSLGIGTTSPTSTLHLNGTAPTILTLGSTSYPSTYLSTFGVDSAARAFLIFGNNAENQVRAGRTTTGGYLDFYTNNTVAQTTLASDGILTMRLSNTGNVGIGTTTTTNGKTVIYNSSGNTLSLQKSGGYAALMMGSENNNYALIESIVNGGIRFYTGDGTLTEKMRIAADGNLGIGTTNPTALLHIVTVNGSILYDNSAAGGSKVQIGSTGLGGYMSVLTSGKKLFLGTINSDISLNTGGSNDFLFSSGGSLGIGTTSPTTKLAVSNGTTIAQVNPDGGVAYFGTVNNYPMALSVNSSEKVRITNDGSVGIGTTSPLNKLHIVNDGNYRVATIQGDSNYTGVGGGQLRIRGNTNVNKTIEIGYNTSTDVGFIQSYVNLGSAQPICLNPDGGSVGIGTISPAGKLEVRTNAASTYVFTGTSTSGYTTTFTMDDTASYFGHDSPVRSLVLKTNSTIRLTIAGGGNVGIGTSNPTALLHNYRSTSTAAPITYLQEAAASPSKTNVLLIERLNNLGATSVSASSAGVRIIEHSANYGLSVEDHSGNSYLAVRGGGNVGIGTAIPTSKLNAYGSGSNLSVFKAEGGNGTLFEVTDQLSGSLFSVNTIAGIPILEVFSNNRLVAGQYGSNALVISGSKVGIGLATPLSNKSLSISGDAQVLGSFTKASGTFLIDHPDPAKPGWKLQHSFVESPTVGDNIYRYVIYIDNTLSGSIELPSYWKFLNENPQIWISPVKHFGAAYGEINEEVSGMNVYANKVGKYNVLLIGTRKDPTIKRLMPEFNVEFESE
jgi:hypothetical protein